MKFDHISLSGSLNYNQRHARKYRTWFPREMRTIEAVYAAREDTSMNRIVATMAILVDAGVCTHRQNLPARDRGSKRK
jgi:hypothetical protein